MRKKASSLKGMLLLFFSFFLLTSLLIFGIAAGRVFSSIFQGNILSYTSKILKESRRNMDSYINQIDLTLTGSANSVFLANFFEDLNSGENDKEIDLWMVEEFLRNSIRFNPKIRDIQLLSADGTVISTSGKGVVGDYNFFNQPWFPKITDERKTRYIAMHPQDYYYENYGGTSETVSAFQPVYGSLIKDEPLQGVVMCNLNRYDLYENMSQIRLEANSAVLLLDENNRIISNTNEKAFHSDNLEQLLELIAENSAPFIKKLGGKMTAVIHESSHITGWTIIALIPHQELLSHLTPLNYILLWVIVFLFSFVFISYQYLNRLITAPVANLIQGMGQIEGGDLSFRLEEETTGEFRHLSDRINSLVERIVQQNRSLYTYELKSKEAQYKALQAQINPHFLFNTLQSIKSAAVNAERKTTSRMITNLGNMLRYGLYGAEDLVPLKQEIAHLEDYLKIQEYRFPGQFQMTLECPEELREKRLIKLLLQPMVENCLVHNRLSESPLEVKIQISAGENALHCRISDNGTGVGPERLDQLTQYLKDLDREDFSESIGIKNVHNRIFLRFGPPYGLTLFSRPGEGFTAKLVLPDLGSH